MKERKVLGGIKERERRKGEGERKRERRRREEGISRKGERVCREIRDGET